MVKLTLLGARYGTGVGAHRLVQQGEGAYMPVVRVLEAGWPHKKRSGEELIGRGLSLADWGAFPLGWTCPRDARRSPLREELVKWMMYDYHHHCRL